MKKILAPLLLATSFCLPLTALAQAATDAKSPTTAVSAPQKEANESYTIDPTHSYVEWYISHFDFSNPSGKWMVNGNLLLNEAHPALSKISVTIPVSLIVTGVPELDKHLQTAEFFDTKQFPTATFVSDKIDVTGHKTAIVHGILTLHGISKPVALDVKLNKIDINPITNKKTAGFSGHTKINRSDFGISNEIPGVSDEVNLRFEVEASLGN